jgi:hypothetical protein
MNAALNALDADTRDKIVSDYIYKIEKNTAIKWNCVDTPVFGGGIRPIHYFCREFNDPSIKHPSLFGWQGEKLQYDLRSYGLCMLKFIKSKNSYFSEACSPKDSDVIFGSTAFFGS